MLGLWSYAYGYDDRYVAGLTSFLCFAFCFALMLMLSCEPGLTHHVTSELISNHNIVKAKYETVWSVMDSSRLFKIAFERGTAVYFASYISQSYISLHICEIYDSSRLVSYISQWSLISLDPWLNNTIQTSSTTSSRVKLNPYSLF